MPTFFGNQKKPASEKSFMQNYGDHLKHVEHQANLTYYRFLSYQSYSKQFSLLGEQMRERIKIFQALYDGYDYADEILGATIVPILSVANTVVFTVAALWEGMQALSIRIGLARDDGDHHSRLAMSYLLGAGAFLLFSAVSLVKSAISLITRPLITMVHGFKPQDTERFYNEDGAYEEPEYPSLSYC
ncbi:hypothetical protein [Legionella oakridgensis]|uniref:Uncharacterized protein n=2 Tax=Legionella oakridgensis TaxID=29423 RepID=W0BCI9_9GAMM|nr:hypothetical protein [Legionella oakridgensis]AHE67580.1 hypothetical protein Loa_02036 [Legionella oakridgensis ATCC 33761 = DSM 21215]ETO92823.1 hypothetical protein LOR_61c14770 [Legionella oakridgensis RV-2-2007]KTD37071.1 hypothetical protein Loak_2207 [Legionella oakridgensis]STY20620.1 Uncharacterised protein [Legionella longbeachae]